MENEMLNKILEEINKVNNKVDSLKIEMNKKFEEVDKRFEELDNKFEGKFEGLNTEVKGIKIELKQLRKEFERHDRGEKMAWQEFENNIGEEITIERFKDICYCDNNRKINFPKEWHPWKDQNVIHVWGRILYKRKVFNEVYNRIINNIEIRVFILSNFF